MKQRAKPVKKPFFGKIEHMHTGTTGEFHIGNFETKAKCEKFMCENYIHALRGWIDEDLVFDNTIKKKA